jgi:hypothetical protein
VDIAILILLGLVFWATRTRRRSVRVVIFSITGGTVIGAVVYTLGLAIVQTIRGGTAESAAAIGLWSTLGWLVDALRLGAAIGLLLGVFVGFVRILPAKRAPRTRLRSRVAAGRSR